MMTRDEQLLSEISAKLDLILAMMVVRNIEDDGEKVRRLHGMDMDNATIAAATGLTKNAVAVRLSRMRKKKRKKGKK